MFGRILTCLIFLACLLVGGNGYAQESWFEQLSVKEGLTHNRINFIFQDSYGYMWATTAHGLNQFDGYSTKTYRFNPSDPHSLPANYLMEVFEAPDGDLWITPGIGGIARFDRKTRGFSAYPLEDPKEKESFWVVYDICWMDNGEVWLGGNHGLYRYLPEQDTILQETEQWEEEFPTLIVVSLAQRGDQLILGTNQGLYQYAPETNEITQLPVQFRDTPTGKPFEVKQFVEDSQGRFWVGTKGAGLLYAQGDQFISFPYGAHPASASVITSLAEDDAGTLWLGDCEHGIWYLPQGAKEFSRFPTQNEFCYVECPDQGDCWGFQPPDQLVRLDRDQNRAIPGKPRELNREPPKTDYVTAYDFDREGNLWIGTFESGLFRQDHQKEYFHTFSDFESLGASDFITAIKSDQEGRIWLRTRMEILVSSSRQPGFQKMPPSGTPLGLEIDSKGQIWILTREGLEFRNASGGLVKLYTNEELGGSTGYQGTVYLYADRKDQLWVLSGNGILRFDPETESSFVFSQLDTAAQNAHLIGNPFTLYQDRAGTYWIGVVKYGMVKLEFEEGPEGPEKIRYTPYSITNQETNPLGSATVSEIFEDESGKLWLGGYSNGLMSFDRETQTYEYYLLEDGRPVPNVQGILQDGNGHLWLSSSEGLFHFHPEEKRYRHFTYTDGLQSNLFMHHARCVGKDGRLYFGGIDGFNAFDPLNMHLAPLQHAPLIREIRVMGEPVQLETTYEEVSEILLKPGQNFLSIDFSAVNFSYPEKITYAYQLEGLDEDWVETREREVNYRHLPPGKYNFKVRATVEGMSWDGPVRQLAVNVRPPFYRTAWFFVLLGLLIVVVALSIHFFRIRAKEQKFREIEAIRKKAAADFHDELGHRLTRISLFTEVLQRKVNGSDTEVQTYLEKISVNSQDLYHSMRNFLWALDPEKDSAFELAVLLKDFGDEMFDRTGISFTMEEIPEDLKKISLNMDWKRHLVLIIKEALHNVLKHSGGTNVKLGVLSEGGSLVVQLEDDGKGFETHGKSSKGFGLRNMQERAGKIGCELDINSTPGQGTRITLRGKVPVS